MNFELSEDQQALLSAIERLVAKVSASYVAQAKRHEFSSTLQAQIQQGGYFSTVTTEELGPVAAVSMIMELCKLPICLELAGSTLVAPYVCPHRAGPIVVAPGALGNPLRFAPVASTIIRIEGSNVAFAALGEAEVSAEESLFAYPMGVLRNPDALSWQEAEGVSAERMRELWRMGIAAETVGCLSAAIHSVLDHVKHRFQFGQALGSFQAIQHRLGQCAMLVESARWLVYRAASTCSSEDGMLALAFAQDAVSRVSYDLHQFMGAMGLTLEHPLHRWTYRAKLLRSDMGGPSNSYAQLAQSTWRNDHSMSEQPLEQV